MQNALPQYFSTYMLLHLPFTRAAGNMPGWEVTIMGPAPVGTTDLAIGESLCGVLVTFFPSFLGTEGEGTGRGEGRGAACTKGPDDVGGKTGPMEVRDSYCVYVGQVSTAWRFLLCGNWDPWMDGRDFFLPKVTLCLPTYLIGG